MVKFLKRYEKYMNNHDELDNNPFKDALKNLKILTKIELIMK